MNIVLILAFLFFIGSVIGWVIELIYRRLFSPVDGVKKWVNPGFLVGPYLPLYGFGLCMLYLLASLEKYGGIENVILEKIVLFAVMAVFMTLIEFIAGEIFIRGLKVELWDYSDEWGNIKGIICPKFSFFWAILGALYYFLVHPRILTALNWLSENLAFSFFIGFFFGVFVLDFCYSVHIVAKIRRFAEEYEIVVKYDELKEHINNSRRLLREKQKFIFAFATEIPFTEHLRQYAVKVRDRIRNSEQKDAK